MSALTDDELNERVAELSGHRRMFLLTKRGFYYRRNAQGYTGCIAEAGRFTKEEAEKHEYPHDEPVTSELEPLPNFASDLNAMHEAERKMPNSKRDEYYWRLSEITQDGRMATVAWTNLTASARQRAEAFVKTMQPKTP